jgi:Flp pilus assembly pilin Flp
MAKTPASNNQTPDETPGEPEVTPTEQLPTEQFPTDAPAAGEKTPVNSGANGYSDLTRADTQPSVFRRHPLATGVTAGVIAVVLISGLTAWGVGTAVTSSLTSSTSAVTPQSTATPAPATGTNGAAGRLKAAGREAFRATIQSMSGGCDELHPVRHPQDRRNLRQLCGRRQRDHHRNKRHRRHRYGNPRRERRRSSGPDVAERAGAKLKRYTDSLILSPQTGRCPPVRIT